MPVNTKVVAGIGLTTTSLTGVATTSFSRDRGAEPALSSIDVDLEHRRDVEAMARDRLQQGIGWRCE